MTPQQQLEAESRRLLTIGVKAGWVRYPNNFKMPMSAEEKAEVMPVKRKAPRPVMQEKCEATESWVMVCKRCGHTWYDQTATCPNCLCAYVQKISNRTKEI